jgi:thimet oligopeptidase
MPNSGIPLIWHSIAEVEESTAWRLQNARSLSDRISAVSDERSVSNTLEPFNDLLIEIDQIMGLADLTGNVHPEAAVREAANNSFQKLAQFLNELKLNRAIYEALNQVPCEGLDADTTRFLTNTLRDYRRAGVDRPEPVRRELAELYQQMVAAGQEFSKNIREGERYIEIEAGDLAGLPPDYVVAHPVAANGRVKITTAYSDYEPFLKYSPREDLRHALYIQFHQRAYPANEAVLKNLLSLRYRYARLLGYPSWAEYSAEDKMVKQAAVISEFIDRVEKMACSRMQQDLVTLLTRKQKDFPGARVVNDWDAYYSQKIRQEKFGVDPQVVRSYFEYHKVIEGLLKLTSDLYCVEFRRVAEPDVWSPEVEAYDVIDHKTLIGRVYLDLFPRRDKFSHVAIFPGQTGLQGRQIGIIALVGNFPGPGTSAVPTFWEHSDVDTFLHEFGHCMHALLARKHHWVSVAGISCQWDFVEVPSQLYEEWAWDATVLARFATAQTGEPIPAALVAKTKQSKEFGKGIMVNRQMAYARLSLAYHDQDPSGLDLLGVWQQIYTRYSPYPFETGTHTYASFGHLDGYSSMYYCYMWSLSLVKDIFTRFQLRGLLDPDTALTYRRAILEQGGAKDGDVMVRDFLNRDFSFEAFQKYLEE